MAAAAMNIPLSRWMETQATAVDTLQTRISCILQVLRGNHRTHYSCRIYEMTQHHTMRMVVEHKGVGG